MAGHGMQFCSVSVQKLTADKAEVAEQQADVSRRERELQAAETAATEARGQLAEQQEKQRSLEQQLQVRIAPTPHTLRPLPVVTSHSCLTRIGMKGLQPHSSR